MKKKIAILGSTGSIGESTLQIIDKDKKNFDVILLTANDNYKKFGSNAIKFSENFSWKKIIRQYLDLI